MYRIGIDVGSTYTKYCIIKNEKIISLYSEKTPIRQKEYFKSKLKELLLDYPGAEVISCGYGRDNIPGFRTINELTALAKGCNFMYPEYSIVVDIGGQDTKVIVQNQGKIREFFLNDKCAAGSGMFLANTLSMIDVMFDDIDFTTIPDEGINMSSICAVFAQSEIVDFMANNIDGMQIVYAVIRHILIQAKKIIGKVSGEKILISGGLTQIRGIEKIASNILRKECVIVEYGKYLSAIGCAMI